MTTCNFLKGTPQQSPSVRKSIRTSFSDSRDRPGANTAVAPATVASTGPRLII